MSVRKLPFVVQPRTKFTKVTLGSEDSGQIEVERRGYLTVGEKALTQTATKDFHAVGDLYQFVQAVAAACDKEPAEVLVDLGAVPTPEYLQPWIDEAYAHTQEVALENARRDLIQATAILISRVDSEWVIDDTMQLHSDLVQELSTFYVEEDRGAAAIVEDTAENTGAEGKE